jgi:hypothetical protein
VAILAKLKKGFAFGLVVAALAFGGLLLSPAAMGRSCGTVGAPGFHAFSTQATGISCARARKALQTWLNNKAKPSSGPRGWHCRTKYARQLWRCTRRHAVVRFTFHSY